MKNIFFGVMIFVFLIFISFQSCFASDIYGWWKPDKEKFEISDLLLITSNKFSGLDYKTIEKQTNIIKIAITNSVKETVIKINTSDNITITSVNGVSFSYNLITHDISLNRKQVEELIRKIKTDPNEK